MRNQKNRERVLLNEGTANAKAPGERDRERSKLGETVTVTGFKPGQGDLVTGWAADWPFQLLGPSWALGSGEVAALAPCRFDTPPKRGCASGAAGATGPGHTRNFCKTVVGLATSGYRETIKSN